MSRLPIKVTTWIAALCLLLAVSMPALAKPQATSSDQSTDTTTTKKKSKKAKKDAGTATDDGGATGSSFSVTVGAGVEALARLRLGRGFAGALRVYAEETIPNTWYLVRETPTLEIGPRVGLGLGLVFPAF